MIDLSNSKKNSWDLKVKLKLENSFITDNTLECEKECFLQTTQNAKFHAQALEKGAKIIDVNECKNF